jgi:hypothetical protein
MKTLQRSTAVVILAAFVSIAPQLLTHRAHAQGRDPALATDLFNQARVAMKSGDLKTACPRFAESHRFDPKVGTLLNLGNCYEKLGDLKGAQWAWQQGVNLAEATKDARVTEARSRLDKLSARIPRLTIQLDKRAPADTTITEDEVELGAGSLNAPLPVNPGKHVVTATAPGFAARTFEVVLAEGEHKTVVVTPGESTRHAKPVASGTRSKALPTASDSHEPPAAESSPAEPKPGRSGRTWSYVLGGVGLAALAAGAATGLLIMSKKNTVDAHCNADNRCDPQGMDASDIGKILVPINTVAWIVGIVGLGGGTVLYLTSGSSSSSSKAQTLVPSPAAGIGVQLGGVF